MDRPEFERMASRVRPQIVAVARNILGNDDDADDIAQETLLKLWSIRDSLDKYSSPEALAAIIARNKCIDRIRRSSDTKPLSDVAFTPDPSLDPEQTLIDNDAGTEADDLLGRLPEMMRTVLTMRHVDGLETSEIAEIIGAREATVRVALSRARKRIREIFEEQSRNH